MGRPLERSLKVPHRFHAREPGRLRGRLMAGFGQYDYFFVRIAASAYFLVRNVASATAALGYFTPASAVLRHSAHGRADARNIASFDVRASALDMKLIGPPMVIAASCWRALISV